LKFLASWLTEEKKKKLFFTSTENKNFYKQKFIKLTIQKTKFSKITGLMNMNNNIILKSWGGGGEVVIPL
jgi:F0F1-type ATP synthase delta subunit